MQHPYVHLVLRVPTSNNFGCSLCDTESDLTKATFDAFDISSRDFDFEEIFIFNEKKLTGVIEASSPTQEQDQSSFSFSYYASAMTVRNEAAK